MHLFWSKFDTDFFVSSLSVSRIDPGGQGIAVGGSGHGGAIAVEGGGAALSPPVIGGPSGGRSPRRAISEFEALHNVADVMSLAAGASLFLFAAMQLS